MSWFKDTLNKITGKERRERKRKEKAYRDYLIERERQAEREAKVQAEKVKQEILDLLTRIRTDWNSSIYGDKIHSDSKSQIYTFENGDKVTLKEGGTLVLETHKQIVTYSIGIIYWNAFVSLLNEVVRITNAKQTKTRKVTETLARKVAPEHPKKKRYDTLIETLKLRKEKLLKMKSTDPEFSSLKAEFEAAERMVNSMKKEYGFA